MSRISPQGYIYGKEPFSDNPFWSDDPLVQYDLTATASVDDTSGDPSVEVTRTETEDPKAVNFDFAFTGLKGQDGQDGQDGTTPEVTATAQVDALSGTPSVQVTRTGPDANPNFDFLFSGLKGEQGPQGDPGPTGPAGGSVEGYIDSWDSTLDQHSGDITGMRFVDHRNALASDQYRASGQVTVKDNNDNSYSMDFGIVPPGGTAGQYLKKKGSADFRTSWESIGLEYDVIALEDCLDGNYYDENPKIDLRMGDIIVLRQDLDYIQIEHILTYGTKAVIQSPQNDATYLKRAAQSQNVEDINAFYMAPIVIDKEIDDEDYYEFGSLFYMELDCGGSAPVRIVPIRGYVNLHIDNRYVEDVKYIEQSTLLLSSKDCAITGTESGTRQITGISYSRFSLSTDFVGLHDLYSNLFYVLRPKVV